MRDSTPSCRPDNSIQCRTGVPCRLQVREASDIGRRDRFRVAGAQRGELPFAQLAGELRLQDRVGARRAAAQVAVGDRGQLVARGAQQRLDLAAQLLAVLQRAGRLEGDAQRLAFILHVFFLNHLGKILRQSRNSRRLFAVSAIFLKMMREFLHEAAAAARGHDDRLDFAAFDRRPPGVDQRAHVGAAGLLVVQVKAQRAATAGARRLDERNAGAVEHARRCGIDARRERRLHAACQHEHAARVARRGPVSCVFALAGFSTSGHPAVSAGTACPRKAETKTAPCAAAARPARPAARGPRRPRPTFCSTMPRPMSARRPYCTPDGQVVSQERQVRQRSRCSCVFAVGVSPSSICLTR